MCKLRRTDCYIYHQIHLKYRKSLKVPANVIHFLSTRRRQEMRIFTQFGRLAVWREEGVSCLGLWGDANRVPPLTSQEAVNPNEASATPNAVQPLLPIDVALLFCWCCSVCFSTDSTITQLFSVVFWQKVPLCWFSHTRAIYKKRLFWKNETFFHKYYLWIIHLLFSFFFLLALINN